MVENLTGYIVRLAEAHCVSAGVLYWKEIRALADKGNIFTFRVSKVDGYSTHTINGLGRPATDFVRALETLTGRGDLSSLTLLNWAGVLPRHPCSAVAGRGARVVCMLGEKQINWFTSLFSGPCRPSPSAHTIAGSCGRRARTVSVGLALWTHARGAITVRAVGRRLYPQWQVRHQIPECCQGDELEWASWVASAFGELLAAAPQITYPPGRDHLAQTIRVCVDTLCSRNASALARLMHVGRGTISRWQRGKSTPRLAHLLSMAYRLGISLLDLLLGSPTFVTSRGFVRAVPVEVNARSQRPTMAYGRRVDRTEVSRILHTALGETPPPSVDQVIRRLSYTGPTIYGTSQTSAVRSHGTTRNTVRSVPSREGYKPPKRSDELPSNFAPKG